MIITYPDEITFTAIKETLISLLDDLPQHQRGHFPEIIVAKGDNFTIEYGPLDVSEIWDHTRFCPKILKLIIEKNLAF